jgi:hypothetical protein
MQWLATRWCLRWDPLTTCSQWTLISRSSSLCPWCQCQWCIHQWTALAFRTIATKLNNNSTTTRMSRNEVSSSRFLHET